MTTTRSGRVCKPTEKTKILIGERDQTQKPPLNTDMYQNKLEDMYEKWKTGVRTIRIKLRCELSEEILAATIEEVEALQNAVIDSYEEFQHSGGIPSQLTRQRVDGCVANSKNIITLAQTRMSEVDDPWDEGGEQARLRNLLDTEFSKSVFGSRFSESSRSSRPRSSKSSCSARSEGHVSISSKRFEATVKLAGMEAELKAMADEDQEKARLEKELKRLETQREIKITKAIINACDQQLNTTAETSPRDQNPCPLIPSATDQVVSHNFQAMNSALQKVLNYSQLPTREPSIFRDDPLQFIKWRRSFDTLVGQKDIRTSDRLALLERYIAGEAAECIEGVFYRSDEDAYNDAWKLLNERFGHPSIVMNSFRKKLSMWPIIGATEYTALRRFSDFLATIDHAIPHIKGLEILNDQEENKKILHKLPDWVISKWCTIAAARDENVSEYPSFHEFAQFLARQAKIATNPVCSLLALRGERQERKPGKEPWKRKATVMASNTQFASPEHETRDGLTRGMKHCVFCQATDHYLPNCRVLLDKNLKDRKEFIQNNKRCYKCLRTGHGSKNCNQPHTCNTCHGKHPTCLHDTDFKPINPNEETPNHRPTEEATSNLRVKTDLVSTDTSFTLPVWISSKHNPKNERLVYALVDSQSDATFVDQGISESLNPAKSETIRLKIKTLNDQNDGGRLCQRISGLQVRGYKGDVFVDLPSAYTTDHIPLSTKHIPTPKVAEQWSHLQEVAEEIPPLLSCEAGVLIGFNCSHAFLPRQCITKGNQDPFAIKTDLGWGIMGYTGLSSYPIDSMICNRIITREAPMIAPSDALRVLERDFSDKHQDNRVVSQDDIKFLQILEDGIRRNEDGHLQMPLPFKRSPSLPNNRHVTTKRLHHLKRKLVADPSYQDEYVKYMNDFISRGDAEEVLVPGDGPQWYIPHHGVFHRQKKKLRVVFDCSAKFQGTSLNDHLLVGPNLISSLMGILCRFRRNPVAIMCDVEKMFHQFKVNEEHRDFLRFLWWKDGDLSAEPTMYRMKVHLFGAASSPGCANYGLKHLARENAETYPMAARFLLENFYVDDGLASLPTEEQAIQLVAQARTLCSRGNLRLHKFVSNSRSVIEKIPASECATNVSTLDLSFEELPIERTLGMQWSVASDEIRFSLAPGDHPSTRRGILSIVASLFDPLGLISPFILTGKKILQEMCRKGTGWDDPIPTELGPRWDAWKRDLQNLKQLAIPRCYCPKNLSDISRVQLHHFSDASLKGYGMCSYLRMENEYGQVHCSLVASKARVSPTKVTTIPRLELTAALVAAEVGTLIKEELQIKFDEELFWTDSRVVLGYIHNESRRFHVFVANRVQKIRNLTKPEQWHHIETDINPADYSSRGLSATELKESTWFSGPDFLWKSNLTVSSHPAPTLQTGDPEVRTISLHTQTCSNFDLDSRLAHISNWNCAVRAIARIRRCVSKRGNDLTKKLTVQETQEAETIIIKGVQKQAFSAEFAQLSTKKSLPSTSSLFHTDPFLHDGIIRVGGRLNNSSLSIGEKHPIILPKHCHITRLIIADCHQKTQHQGRGITLNRVRSQGYWIVGGSREVASVIKGCVVCRKLRGQNHGQKMAALPNERLEPTPPFTYVGMDCFGPFLVKNGRREMKRYGLLLTCFCSRAVHVEMLDDLSTDSFINSLRCFIALRGAVREIRSDRGTNFVGASNELKNALKEVSINKIERFLMDVQCDFVFNTPNASHTGGLWERQIRSLRNVLNATLHICPGKLDDSSLRTFLYEAMAIVNTRPLTVENLNDPTSPESLTPNHVLTMKTAIPLPPPGNFVRADLYLRKRWRRTQYMIEQFWSRWRREYLTNIALRQKWHKSKRNLMVGDLVLISDSETPRMEWPMAKVIDAPKDDDGLVRHVKLTIGTKNLNSEGKRLGKVSILERPVQKLVLILESE